MNDPKSAPLKHLDAIEYITSVLFAYTLKLHDDGECCVVETGGAGHAYAPLGAHGLENTEGKPVIWQDVDDILASDVFTG